MSDNFIDSYRDNILNYVPTSKDWAESIATSVLSTVMGSRRKIYNRIGALHLNVWYLMVGPSGLAYKTAPLLYFAMPTLAEVTRKIDYPVILPSRYSLEGLMEYIASGHNMGIIIRDEFTGMIKEAYGKQYLADIIEFLSELYDGGLQKRYTRKAKLEQAVDVYVSFLAATTPYLYRLMKPDFFIQGTGNRLMYILHTSQKHNYPPAEEFFYELQRDKAREEQLKAYASDLAKLYSAPFEYISPLPEAGQMWMDFKVQKETSAQTRFEKDFYDLHYTYMVRLPEMALKLSGLRCVSRSYQTLPKSSIEQIMINAEDMKWAIEKVERHYKYFEEFLKTWRTKPEPMEARTFGDQTNFILELLHTSGGLTWSELRRKAPWEKRIWSEIMRYLWDTKQICVWRGKARGKGGPLPIVVYPITQESEACVREKEPIVSWELFAQCLGLSPS